MDAASGLHEWLMKHLHPVEPLRKYHDPVGSMEPTRDMDISETRRQSAARPYVKPVSTLCHDRHSFKACTTGKLCHTDQPLHRDFVISNPGGEGPVESPETLLERLGFPHRTQHRQASHLAAMLSPFSCGQRSSSCAADGDI